MIKDSGNRTEFESGFVRDIQEGKGRMDLLPWYAILDLSKHCEEGAKKYGESKLVVNAIGAHHGDVEMQSLEAVLVQAADAISAARPGARRETLEAYIKRLEKLEEISNSYEGVEKSYAIQAGREIRIMVKPDQIDDAGSVELARNLAKDIEEQLEYPGQIKISVIRETRAIDFAK